MSNDHDVQPLPHPAVDGHDADAPEPVERETTLLSEQLVVSTETHEWSRVKITRRIVTEERTITVPVRREELVIEYPEHPAPMAHPGTVRGTTDTVDSVVTHEFVLHEETPRVVVEARPYEKVQLIVDTQQSMVEVSGRVAREELVVENPAAVPMPTEARPVQ